MAKRHNHYEMAFEDYLRTLRAPYVAVDERRRALAEGGSLKSVDFIVSPGGVDPRLRRVRWLVDVKGRRFPSGGQYWRNWATGDDLVSLARWWERFGDRFEPVLIFAYHLVGDRSPVPAEQVHYWRGEAYGFVAAPAALYARRAIRLSARWGTVAMPAAEFRRLARPVAELLNDPELEVSAAWEHDPSPEPAGLPAGRGGG